MGHYLGILLFVDVGVSISYFTNIICILYCEVGATDFGSNLICILYCEVGATDFGSNLISTTTKEKILVFVDENTLCIRIDS